MGRACMARLRRSSEMGRINSWCAERGRVLEEENENFRVKK